MSTTITCPTDTHDLDGTPHTIIGCGSTNVEITNPEGEPNTYDCLDCGIFFNATQEKQPTEDVAS